MSNNLLEMELVDSTDSNKNASSESNKNKKSETVEIEKSTLDALIKRIDRLEKTGNKSRLANYDRMNDENPDTIIKLRVIDGKVVIGWSDLLTNKAEVDPTTRKIIEDQKLEVYYEDGSKEIMDIVVFNRRFTHIFMTLKEETNMKTAEDRKKYGNRKFVLESDDGKEYTIGEKFVN